MSSIALSESQPGFGMTITTRLLPTCLADSCSEVQQSFGTLIPLNGTYEEFVQAGQRLARALIDHAQQRGMNVAIGAPTTDFALEFAPILKGAERNNLRTRLTIVPGAKTSVDDPQLEELALTTLRATLATYPKAEYITVWMPEVRQWTGEYEKAWQALDAKYGISKIRSLDDVMAAAASRKGSEVPPGPRFERGQRGHHEPLFLRSPTR